VSLLLGVLILALAVFLGGLAAVFRRRGERAMPAVRAFAVVAAASIAVLHLLPEAIGEIGWRALLAAAAGFVAPAALERLFPPLGAPPHDPSRPVDETDPDYQHRAPTTALAMGYAAVLAHQLGEGAAVASLARVGSLSVSILLAIAAHTVPLAMVVAIRVLEVKGDAGGRRAMGLALAGVALATAAGAFAARLVGATRIAAVEPWLIATVAGILLHALSHEALASAAATTASRTAEAVAGLLGLALAVAGVESTGWIQHIPWALRAVGVALLAGLIIARSFVPIRAGHRHHAHRH
jgi:ZIP family zinc transporter